MPESELILEALDSLVRLHSDTSLEFGWLADEYFENEKVNLVAEFGSERGALSECINFIYGREAHAITARSTVADRMRVARYMTREKYRDIIVETGLNPTFHQLRACLMTYEGVVDERRSDSMVTWCVENEWPTVEAIREHRNGTEVVSIEERHIKRLVKAATVVIREHPRLSPWWGAAQIVLDTDEKAHAPDYRDPF